MTLWHVTRQADVQSIKIHGLLPLIGPRSAKIGEPRRAVYLFRDRDSAEDAVMNWLGDELDEDEDLALLEIRLPESAKDSLDWSGAGYEVISYTPIHPDNIAGVYEI